MTEHSLVHKIAVLPVVVSIYTRMKDYVTARMNPQGPAMIKYDPPLVLTEPADSPITYPLPFDGTYPLPQKELKADFTQRNGTIKADKEVYIGKEFPVFFAWIERLTDYRAELIRSDNRYLDILPPFVDAPQVTTNEAH